MKYKHSLNTKGDKMNKYELTILVHPDLEQDLNNVIDKVKKIITDNNGVIDSEDNWGKKRLAYPIKKRDFAIYYYFILELPPESLKKISSVLNITDEVIRYLLVKFEKEIDPKKDEDKTSEDSSAKKE